jgi:uncharacterized protein YjbJ (UPF0337 family)
MMPDSPRAAQPVPVSTSRNAFSGTGTDGSGRVRRQARLASNTAAIAEKPLAVANCAGRAPGYAKRLRPECRISTAGALRSSLTIARNNASKVGVGQTDHRNRKEYVMNWEQIQGKWNKLKGNARVEWARLSDQDLERVAGEREKLVGLIQEKYGRTKKEAEEEIDNWCRRVS